MRRAAVRGTSSPRELTYSQSPSSHHPTISIQLSKKPESKQRILWKGRCGKALGEARPPQIRPSLLGPVWIWIPILFAIRVSTSLCFWVSLLLIEASFNIFAQYMSTTRIEFCFDLERRGSREARNVHPRAVEF